MVSQMNVITDEELAQFEEIFKRIDKDNDGAISPEELKQVMDSTFMQVSKKDIQNMIRNADLDNNGRIEFLEFVKILKKRSRKNKFLAAFKCFDKDGSGTISTNEIKEVLEKLGESISDEQLTNLIEKSDKDGDGALNYYEFLNVMVK